MAENFYRFLRPGERVLYCQPTIRAGWIRHFAGAIGLGLLGPLTDPEGAGLTVFLGMLLVLMAARVIALAQYGGGVEAAVTDRRILHVGGVCAALRATHVAAEDVAAIEVLGRALRVTKKNGQAVVFEQLSHAPEVGLALARAAGVTQPWVPAVKERLAEELVVFSVFVAAALTYALTLGAQASGNGEAIPLVARLPFVTLGLLMAVAGGFLGLLAGLAALKPHFTRDGMRAWMRQSDIFAPRPHASARISPLTRYCLEFVDSLYGRSADPLDQRPTGQDG